jgi:hypothetical protein
MATTSNIKEHWGSGIAKFDYLLYRVDSTETLLVREHNGKHLLERSAQIKPLTINGVQGILPANPEVIAEFATWKEARDYAHAMLMKTAEGIGE